MSETTNLKLFKHDNPETNTDQFDVDKSLNGNWDKLDKAVGQANTKIATLEKDNTTNKTDITNIKAEQTTQNTELKELKAENKRLKQDLNGLPTGTLEGETIYITDSAEMRFSEFNVRGNSKQESRSGKNKLNCNLINNSETKNGVTATKNKDGSYTFKGTSTDNVTFYLTRNMNLEVTKTMIGSGQNNLTGLVYNVQYYKKDSTTLTYARFQGNIFKEGDIIDSIYVQSNETGILVSGTIFPQLEEGTTITDYEQYGASPSPDYPSEVESCGDNVNLFEQCNGIWYDTNSYKYINNATVYGFMAKVKPNTTYTISKKNQGNRFIITAGSQPVKTENSLTRIVFASNHTITNYTFTTQENESYVFLGVHNGTNASEIALAVEETKIVEGTNTGAYSPYGQGCINEVVCNKNFANITAENKTSNGVTITNNGDGSVTLNGTATAGTSFAIARVDIKSTNYGYYTLSNKIISGSYSTARLRTSLKNTKATANLIDKSIDEVWATNIQEDTGDLTIWCEKGVVLNNITILTQLEKGQGATEWELGEKQTFSIPTQQPMRSIGDIRDTFVKVDGKWYERHYIKELIFNGSEHFIFDGVYNNIYQFSSEISNLMNDITEEDINVKSNYFNGIRWRNSWLQDNSISCMISYKKLRFYTSKFTTVDEFKAWLSSNNVRAYYPLITPTDIECTPEQSTILDNLENTVKSYKGVTHIYSTDEVAPDVEVTYKKDLDTMINNLNTALVALGGI